MMWMGDVNITTAGREGRAMKVSHHNRVAQHSTVARHRLLAIVLATDISASSAEPGQRIERLMALETGHAGV
jgi:hypothetical protein